MVTFYGFIVIALAQMGRIPAYPPFSLFPFLIKALKTKVFVRNRKNTGRHFKHSNPQTENMGQSANSGQGGRSERAYSDVLKGNGKH